MNLETAKILTAYNEEIEVHEDYSGRGMYGKKTGAICCDSMSDIFKALHEWSAYNDFEDPEQAQAFTDALYELSNLRSDSMGLGMVYY